MADERPDFVAASVSSTLASLSAALFCSNALAIASKQAFFSAVVSLASSRDATLACRASRVICSVKVMPGEGKPKSQTEKCEVSGFLDAGSLDDLPTAIFLMAIFTNLLPKKGEPVSGFG